MDRVGSFRDRPLSIWSPTPCFTVHNLEEQNQAFLQRHISEVKNAIHMKVSRVVVLQSTPTWCSLVLKALHTPEIWHQQKLILRLISPKKNEQKAEITWKMAPNFLYLGRTHHVCVKRFYTSTKLIGRESKS